MSFPNYVLNNNLTDTYIQSLISRNGFTDVTNQYPQGECLYAIRDSDGITYMYYDMPSVRDDMIRKYLIMSNG